MNASKSSDSVSLGDIEDLIHNFLIIMLEHSMRQKDGWKVDICLFIFFPAFDLFIYLFLHCIFGSTPRVDFYFYLSYCMTKVFMLMMLVPWFYVPWFWIRL